MGNAFLESDDGASYLRSLFDYLMKFQETSELDLRSAGYHNCGTRTCPTELVHKRNCMRSGEPALKYVQGQKFSHNHLTEWFQSSSNTLRLLQYVPKNIFLNLQYPYQKVTQS